MLTRLYVLASAFVLVLPVAAFAQASITGVVRDTSGAVLPGVTVEASSPALLERVRSVITDGTGQYRFVDLRPGAYSVTFTLPGFNTFKRDGVELAGNFTATINAELRVGALEETITVTGESPVVDVQGVARQTVLSHEVVEAIPTSKYFVSLGALTTGVTASCAAACQTATAGGGTDSGGAAGDTSATLIAHGGRFRDQRISINNMTVRGATGYLGVTGPNIEAQQETQIDTSGADASIGTGGVRINVVPKEGGNRFAGSVFITGTNEHLQANNIDEDLRRRGLVGTTEVKKIYDVAPTFGGPIARDRLWFFLSARRSNAEQYAANLYPNKNAYNPGAWTYEPDLTTRVVLGNALPMAGARLTWQANERNKLAVSFDYRDRCTCPNLAGSTTSPEGATNFMFRPQHVALANWSAPLTNRLLIDVGAAALIEGWGNRPTPGLAAAPGTIRVIEQNPPPGYIGITTFRGSTGGNWTQYPYWNTAFNLNYVTGAHAFKAGVEYDWGYTRRWATPNLNGPITSIRVNNGVPNQFTVNAGPVLREDRARYDGGLYVQDKWTMGKLTLSGGLRWDFFNRYTPEITLGPSVLLPTRNLTFPEYQVTKFNDLSPRMGAAYDVFGNGRTAVKASLNRYVQDLSLHANSGGSPLAAYQDSASRSWTDSNRNFFPDCNWTNPAAQNLTATGGDICGAFTGTSANFGTSVPTSVNDRDVNGFGGWNKRGYNWEFHTSVQQEIIPRRMAIDIAYFRRWYGNFLVTDNFATQGSDYSTFSVTVPTDPRLPLSGRTITGFYDINPDKQSVLSDERVRFSSHYGEQYEYWQGVDVGTGVRFTGGTLLQGSISTGKAVTDNCEVLAKVPEGGTQGVSTLGQPANLAGGLAGPFCHQEQPWLMQYKAIAAYTLPVIDVQISGTFLSVPGPQVNANLNVPNAQVQPTLGRPLAGNAANVTVRIVAPGTLYGDRNNQFDFRVGKILRFGGTRATASVDVFNVLNGNAVLLQNETYSLTNPTLWTTPRTVQQARLVKFSLSMNF